jgi:shikimate kinase
MDEENAEILKNNGIVIWLVADAETIIQRMYTDSQNQGKRPPLSGDDLYKETTELLERRLPVYRSLADFSVDTAGKSTDQIVDEICLFLKTKGKQ